jgi:hypothetical protein
MKIYTRNFTFSRITYTLLIITLCADPAFAQLKIDYGKSYVNLTKGAGGAHTRCIVCHAGANNAMRLTPLAAGATTFTEEQSKTNFETLSRIVVAGKPMESHFLLHPLQPEFGGGMYHSGGRQFKSTDDPDWRKMEAWVKGAK